MENYFKCITKDCFDGPVYPGYRQGKSLAVLFPSLEGVVSPWKDVAKELMEAAAEIPMAAAAATTGSQASSSGSLTQPVDLEPDSEMGLILE